MDNVTQVCNCQGLTSKGASCKNIGKYKASELLYCHLHVPRSDVDCVICMNKLFDVAVIPCGHQFHYQCLRKWFRYNTSCPICRCVVIHNINKQEYQRIMNKYVGDEYELVRNIAIYCRSGEELNKCLMEIGMQKD